MPYRYCFTSRIFTILLMAFAFFLINISDSFSATPDSSVVARIGNAITPQQLLNVIPNEDHVLGQINAPVTVVEYASLSCSHCAQFNKEVFPGLKKNYIDTGKIRYVYRDFPLNAPALTGTLLTHCVRNDDFYKMIDVLFHTQDQWAFSSDYDVQLRRIAKLGGVDNTSYDRCTKDENLQKKYVSLRAQATEVLGIQGTPTFFINGEQYKNMSLENFSKIIDAELAKKK